MRVLLPSERPMRLILFVRSCMLNDFLLQKTCLMSSVCSLSSLPFMPIKPTLQGIIKLSSWAGLNSLKYVNMTTEAALYLHVQLKQKSRCSYFLQERKAEKAYWKLWAETEWDLGKWVRKLSHLLSSDIPRCRHIITKLYKFKQATEMRVWVKLVFWNHLIFSGFLFHDFYRFFHQVEQALINCVKCTNILQTNHFYILLLNIFVFLPVHLDCRTWRFPYKSPKTWAFRLNS